jgi:hypothetical protein
LRGADWSSILPPSDGRTRGAEDLFYKTLWALEKQARRGFRGYPVATVAFYGPDDQRATKVAVGIVPAEGAEADPLQRWFSEEADVRSDPDIARGIIEFIETHAAKSVVLMDRIIGCPHEEEVDYPVGTACPQCRVLG